MKPNLNHSKKLKVFIGLVSFQFQSYSFSCAIAGILELLVSIDLSSIRSTYNIMQKHQYSVKHTMALKIRDHGAFALDGIGAFMAKLNSAINDKTDYEH